MRKEATSFFMGVMLVGGIFVSPEASAQERRVHFSQCMVMTGTEGHSGHWGYGFANHSTSEAGGVTCPIDNWGDWNHVNINTLNIHGYQASGKFSAIVTVGFFGVNGGAAGAYVQAASGTGMRTVSPSTSVLNNYPYDFAQVHVGIPPRSSDTRSEFRGYYMAG